MSSNAELIWSVRMKVPATIATVVYALPPVLRLTTLGIRRNLFVVLHRQGKVSTVEGSLHPDPSRRQFLYDLRREEDDGLNEHRFHFR